MPITWSDEKLLALAPEKLEVLRRNALARSEAELVTRIETIQDSRRSHQKGSSDAPVIGFHFTCRQDYEVTMLPNGDFWSGIWAVDDSLVGPAIALKGYVALHNQKRLPSYRQGTIIDWKSEPRTKGLAPRMGVTFLLRPFDEDLPWFGGGSGEKGYRRLDDNPRWNPRI